MYGRDLLCFFVFFTFSFTNLYAKQVPSQKLSLSKKIKANANHKRPSLKPIEWLNPLHQPHHDEHDHEHDKTRQKRKKKKEKTIIS